MPNGCAMRVSGVGASDTNRRGANGHDLKIYVLSAAYLDLRFDVSEHIVTTAAL
jgi:hypothetical protein